MRFRPAGLRCFGPGRLAARLEGSKAFTKQFLQRHGIPSAAYRSFTRENFDPAWLRAQRAPIVVKASGLAVGQGRGHRAERGGGRSRGGRDVQRPLR